MNTAYRLHRAVHHSGSTATSFFFALIALLTGIAGFFVYMIVLWPCALLAAIAAILSDPKQQFVSYCESCGNEVAPTSKHCPHCHTDLIAAPHRRRHMSPILLGTLIFLGIIAIFFLWLKVRS